MTAGTRPVLERDVAHAIVGSLTHRPGLTIDSDGHRWMAVGGGAPDELIVANVGGPGGTRVRVRVTVEVLDEAKHLTTNLEVTR